MSSDYPVWRHDGMAVNRERVCATCMLWRKSSSHPTFGICGAYPRGGVVVMEDGSNPTGVPFGVTTDLTSCTFWAEKDRE